MNSRKLTRIKQSFNSMVDRFDRLISTLFRGSKGTKKFVIFTSGRSGSNFLLSVINQHPGIVCFSELYHPDKIWINENNENKFLKTRVAYTLRNMFPRLFIHGFWYLNRKKPIVGFKYIWFHSSKIRKSVLLNPNVKKVLLTRKNILRTEVSRQIADHTNEWIMSNKSTKCNTIQFNLSKFWHHYKRTYQEINELKHSLIKRDQKYIEIFYEDLTGKRQDLVMEKLCDFLSVKPWKFKFSEVGLKRQNPYTLRELLENYEEVEKALSGTEVEWMLQD